MAKYSAIIEKTEFDQEIIVLSGGGMEAKLWPAKGGNLCAWKVDGQDMLLSPASFDPEARGGYGLPVMFPYANRLVDGKFKFEGKEYEMMMDGRLRIMHGLVGSEPFEVGDLCADDDKAAATISVEIKPGTVMYTVYPFHLKLYMTYSISACGLALDWKVVNLEKDKRSPFGFGVHTYFNKVDSVEDTFVKVPTYQLMETDNCYPTRKIIDTEGTTYDLQNFRKLSELNLDNLYAGLSSDVTAEIEYRASGRKLLLNASDDMKYMILFTPPRLPGFCLENQTNCTNGHNFDYEGKKRMANLIVLEPGEEHCGWIHVTHEYMK